VVLAHGFTGLLGSGGQGRGKGQGSYFNGFTIFVIFDRSQPYV
jgi:hypothetical protein